MTDVHGTVAPGFEPVRDAFEAQFKAGEHIGAGVAVYLHGRRVVDLWGGLADEASGRRWERDTMAVSYSTTKGLAATCLHVLASRGAVAYNEPVATYWPEFARNGKAAITVRQVLSHSAGVPQLPPGTTVDDLCDWQKMIHGIEELEPLWEPGTESGYHALTFGYLVGEIVRRVSGRSIGAFLRDEVARPLGIDSEMYIGAPPEVHGRIATLVSRMDADPGMRERWRAAMGQNASLVAEAMSPAGDLNAMLNTPQGRAAEIPAASGAMTARALARMYACLGCGELDGVRLVSDETLRAATKVQSLRPDRVIILPIAWSLGYMNGQPGWPQGPRDTGFGHAGFGGSVGFADPESGMAFGFVVNALMMGLIGAGRASTLSDAARACVAVST